MVSVCVSSIKAPVLASDAEASAEVLCKRGLGLSLRLGDLGLSLGQSNLGLGLGISVAVLGGLWH